MYTIDTNEYIFQEILTSTRKRLGFLPVRLARSNSSFQNLFYMQSNNCMISKGIALILMKIF